MIINYIILTKLHSFILNTYFYVDARTPFLACSPTVTSSPTPEACNIHCTSETAQQDKTTQIQKLYARQRKRVQGLQQALNMKKKRQHTKDVTLEALRTMLPERIVNFIALQLLCMAEKTRENVTHLKGNPLPYHCTISVVRFTD